MTHVEIRLDTRGSTREERASLMVDGHELVPHVLADGFRVEFPTDPEQKPIVHIPIEASILDIDLPDAVLEVMKVDERRIAEIKAQDMATYEALQAERNLREAIVRRLSGLLGDPGVAHLLPPNWLARVEQALHANTTSDVLGA